MAFESIVAITFWWAATLIMAFYVGYCWREYKENENKNEI